MGHDGVASGYPTPTGFRRLTGCQQDPRDRGVTSLYSIGNISENIKDISVTRRRLVIFYPTTINDL